MAQQFADDSFSDDDVDVALEIAKSQHGAQQQNYQLEGQIAVLENQLAELRRSQFQKEDAIRDKYKEELRIKDHQLREKERELKERDTQIELWKDKDEFKAIDENLSSLKRRKLNDSHMIPTPPQLSSLGSGDMEAPREKIMVLNQTAWYEDERSAFTESISSYVIPGTKRPVLEYLADVTSRFDYEYCGLSMTRDMDNFKATILRFLIEFDDKHRLDLLVGHFIQFVFDYIGKCMEGERASLLQVLFLLPLMNFSLVYRPKAISDELIQSITKQVTQILLTFPDIVCSEINYLSTSDGMDIHTNDADYSFLEKPVHVKIMEVFCCVYAMNIVETLAQLAAFRMENFANSRAGPLFWGALQPKLVYLLLQPLTTPQFVMCGLNILQSSTFDKANFAFTFKKDRNGEAINHRIVTCLMGLLDEPLSKNRFHLTGLNELNGPNHFTRIVELLAPLPGEQSSQPRTHPLEKFQEAMGQYGGQGADRTTLEFKLRLLNVIETLMVMNEAVDFAEVYETLFKRLSREIAQEQRALFEHPRSGAIGLRIETVCKCILLVKYMITDQGFLPPLQTLHGRQFVLSILKVCSNNMRDMSLNFLRKVRASGYEGPVFNADLETAMLDKFGDLTPDFKLELETELVNGIEFSYPADMIQTCKELVIELVGEQDSDKMLASINYDLDVDMQSDL